MRLGRRGREHAGIARQPVADESARRTAEALKLRRLERQDAEDVVDIGLHRRAPGPAATPRRSGRCSGRSGSPGLAARTFLATRKREIGIVDGDQAVRSLAATIARAVSPMRLIRRGRVAEHRR